MNRIKREYQFSAVLQISASAHPCTDFGLEKIMEKCVLALGVNQMLKVILFYYKPNILLTDFLKI